jgi:uncharacterized protein (DUF1800 family)
MKFASSKHLAKIIQLSILLAVAGVLGVVDAATNPPVLISDSVSTRAIAFESVTQRPEPFALTASANFSTDTRTRVEIFALNLDLLAGEGASALTADAEDASHNHYPLTVEYVGQIPQDVDLSGNVLHDWRGIYMIVLRLNDAMGDLGDVLIRVNLHGVSTNRVRIAVGHVGGGPADDVGAGPTPAPQTPPTTATPLTIDQYRAQFSNPSFSSDQDLRRFLEQAIWGGKGDDSDFNRLRSIGMQAYLNEQFNTAPVFSDVQSDYPSTPLYPINQPSPCDATCVRDNYTLYPLQKQFFTNALTQPDQLRQRVAFALHKVIVVSGRDLNNNEASWFAPYLQTIDRNAFGNFRTLLYEITLNPGMGEYLNMRGNSAANGTPNENYAREIMQLFSIGVDTLNPDGTPVLDAQGNRVPSYDNSTITNLARVFTGWDLGPNKVTNINGVDTPVTNYLDPMPLNGNTNRYDLAQKTLFGVNFPACTTSNPPCTTTAQRMTYKTSELNQAIDLLFNHGNAGPYLCTQLIHQLVTSNPSPAYVGRCSGAFANNGAGVRGDMKAVITAILLDPEARGDLKSDPNYGHLREPVLYIANLLRTFNATSDGVLATNNPGATSFTVPLGQNLFNPPTVFSYFPADYGLPGTKLFGPEFGILDTSTTYQRANFLNTLFLANNGNGIPASLPNRPAGTQVNYSTFQAMAGNAQQLVDALNARMMHGTMSQAMNANIVAAVNAIASSDAAPRTRTAIYLIATSSQYQVGR